MEENRIKSILAQKLTAYRKRAGMTQAELAEKLNYSDKSISKWERGDGMPDLLVLCKLADLYDVPLDSFLREGPLVRSQAEQKTRHIIITLISIGLVFFVAAIAFFVCYLAKVNVRWLAFIYAVPGSSGRCAARSTSRLSRSAASKRSPCCSCAPRSSRCWSSCGMY